MGKYKIKVVDGFSFSHIFKMIKSRKETGDFFGFRKRNVSEGELNDVDLFVTKDLKTLAIRVHPISSRAVKETFTKEKPSTAAKRMHGSQQQIFCLSQKQKDDCSLSVSTT